MTKPHDVIRTPTPTGWPAHELSWPVAATICGLVAGPAVGVLEFSCVSVNSFMLPPLILGFMAAVVVAACFVVLWIKAMRTMRWSRTASGLRTAATLAVGGVLWALPGGWSVPARVLGAPFDWLLLTAPFGLAAMTVSPSAPRRKRILAVASLVGVALAWPTACGLAAAEVRHQTGTTAGSWFVSHVDGHSASSIHVRQGGVTEVDYRARGANDEDFDDLVLASWPATAGTPCAHFEDATVCKPATAGTFWVGYDGSGNETTLAMRRGSRWIAASVDSGSRTPVPAESLPKILTGAWIAGDDEFLAAVNGY